MLAGSLETYLSSSYPLVRMRSSFQNTNHYCKLLIQQRCSASINKMAGKKVVDDVQPILVIRLR